MAGLARTYLFAGRPGGAERVVTAINLAFIYLRSSLAKEAPIYEYDLEDYAHQIIALLPTGPAWEGADSGDFGALIRGLAAEFERASNKICELENETFPLNTTQLLPDWERVLGLPEVEGILQSTTERRAAVVTKFATIAEPTPQFFIQLAADFGYGISVVEHFPARVGRARIGDAINAPGNEFTWSVRVPGSYTQSRRAQVGDVRIGDRIATWGDGSLEYLLEHYSPAHTTLVFLYE